MAVTETSISELLDQLNAKSLEDPRISDWSWKADPIDPFTTYSVSGGGTSHPSYGAVPNVTAGSGIASSTFSPNSVWTSTGTGPSGMWTNTTSTGYTIGNPTAPQINQGGKVHIQGENADLVIGDKSMRAWMEKVEERLNILTPNPDMEKEWDDLRKLGERYRKLEKKCKEKSDVWNKLKSMPRPNLP